MTARRVNLRFVALISIALLLAGAAVRFQHDRQASHLGELLLEEAKGLESAERFGEAAICLERYAKLAPHNNDVMVRLGKLLSRVADRDNRHS